LKNYLALENFLEIVTVTADTIEELRDDILDASIVVDALLGTGLKGPVEGTYKEIIESINEADGIVFSVDIPSGVEADTGKVGSVAVEADYTETLVAPKLGLLLYPGADCVGKLYKSDIGIPEYLVENAKSNIYLTTEDYVFDLMPVRVDNSHKGTYGKVLSIAGSYNMTGAGLMTALSALKMGAGLSTLACPWSLLPYYAGKYPEITYLPLLETTDKTIAASAAEQLSSKIETYDVVLFGPGIGVNDDTIKFTEKFLRLLAEKEVPAVVDADGLNCLARCDAIELNDNIVLTPHPMELSRLVNVDVDTILDDRLKYVQEASEKYNCNVLLKGSNSLIVSNSCTFINPTGNSALAKAGTGDVLTGIIGGLIAQGLPTYDATLTGAYIHGIAGELVSEDETEYSVLATDVINYLPKVLIKLGLL
jgi:NAD(P)H-hydrate epimerase